ncbi:TniB family NTP-binding protein [Microbacterium horticulturae]|uniref:TniB family NTP-binding protein n=1 Tax=Microbacterium horticulturae TaxID=3028316 RepID=A0ABY8BWW5_9MICO|nr:TniB family NTP-binding protein [Microbacterium sp. KACC 23027]WEG08644.1 TniB family NTP-binding protein [Microbacterium sp. KACC 23027]
MTINFTQPGTGPLALNRRESLLAYLTTPVPEPPILTRAGYDALPEPDRNRHDAERIAFLSGGLVINTPSIARCKKELVRALAANSARNSGHAGVMLTGNSTMGKTTTAKALMRWVVDQYTVQFPEWQDADHIPAVYVEVPAAATGKTLMKVFADFLGLSVMVRDTADDLRVKVVQALRRANTQVIVVDELHNLAGRTPGVGEASDVLKGLSNDLTATFLYAGIDLTTSGLMVGPRGQQLSGRFTAVPLAPYEWTDPEQRKTWRGVIRAFETKCGLLDSAPNTLKPLAEYLYQRTSGSLGALSRLLTGTAIGLISGEGPEEFTQAVLDEYTLDYTSELRYARRDLPSVTARRNTRARGSRTASKTHLTPRTSEAIDAAKRKLTGEVDA